MRPTRLPSKRKGSGALPLELPTPFFWTEKRDRTSRRGGPVSSPERALQFPAHDPAVWIPRTVFPSTDKFTRILAPTGSSASEMFLLSILIQASGATV